MLILGISAFYHDSAAALLRDGAIVAAAQEERFSRIKHDARFPFHAVRYCLDEAGAGLDDLASIVFYEKPFLKFERLLETYLATAPRGFRSFRTAMPIWIKQKLFQKRMLCSELRRIGASKDVDARLLFTEHHQSHAASAFFPSPFERAVVVTMDGVGEWATTSVSIGDGNRLECQKEIHFPHSLGLLYTAFTYYTGFKVNSGEYKVMGLAPYGEPKYARRILDHLIDVKADGSFRLDQRYFDYATGLTMTNRRFADLFGGPPRHPESPLTQRDMDLAASVQAVTEEVVGRLTRSAARETGLRNLSLAGGVALNCVANGQLLRSGAFDGIWVQPAAGDAGGALGAAFAAWHQHHGGERKLDGERDAMRGACLGPAFEDDAIEARFEAAGAVTERQGSEEATIALAAEALASGQALGWFQGRMEFGPRALGARSILADPRSATMQKTLNLKVKHRESFRPFAPSVPREDVADWFELDGDSPYMLLVADVAAKRRIEMTAEQQAQFGLDKLNVPRSTIPAVTHVDYSARLQTVHADTHPRFHALLSAFKARTGCPVLVNTSFNVRGEPIVCTPEEAFRCLMGTELDLLSPATSSCGRRTRTRRCAGTIGPISRGTDDMALRKRVLFHCMTAVMVLAVMEGMARVAWYAAHGEAYARTWVPPAGGRGWEERADGPAIPVRWVRHPYYGFTNSWEGSDLNVMPFVRRQEGAVIVALLGGSVGIGVTPAFERAVHEYFADHVPGVEPIVLGLALDGMKQPQQLMVVANMLALGGEFDIIVNLDGHNEIEEPHGNVSDGTFPFFPYWWSRLVSSTVEQTALRGSIQILRDEQAALSCKSRKVPWGWSAVYGLAVRHRLERAESRIRSLHLELERETEAEHSLERHGPKVEYGSEDDVRREAVNVWYRSSVALATLAARSGAEYYHMLQPNQYVPGSKPLTEEELEVAWSRDDWREKNYRATYPLLVRFGDDLKKQGIGFFDLTRIFADNHETLYRDDCCHFNERGYELLADAMLRRVLEATNIGALSRPDP